MPEMSSDNEQLGLTARWTALGRAEESQREDALFHDPWAASLAGELGQGWEDLELPEEIQKALRATLTVRTRFFDDFLQHAVTEQKIRQVVLLAAGLDARAFRLPWPEQTRLFELDQPHVLEYKEQVLAAGNAKAVCERRIIKVDLRDAWAQALKDAGFDAGQPSVWLMEGLQPYLSSGALERLFDEITSLSVPQSRLGFDAAGGTWLTSELVQPMIKLMARVGIFWLSSMDDPQAFLKVRGWSATVIQTGEESANYGRWPFPVIPRSVPDVPRSWLVVAQKK
jgi:methyltransferase (TIGR00027 family)